MAQIFCTPKLWRIVRTWSLPKSAPPSGNPARLRTWGATRFHEREDDFLLAVNAATLLTVVVRLRQPEAFASDFAASVGLALDDIGVSARASGLLVRGNPTLQRLHDPEMRRALAWVESCCGLEVCYHSDVRVIQRNLNDAPHLDGVPAERSRAVLAGTDRDNSM